ncbi:hypothetical protein DOJK_00278 [Patescibacteria group bacterium]|nr:hypothetical protein DOJK_00278 [Patescibacteria group bacterium]
MFELDRTFCQRNMKTGLMEWFFYAREGIFGPYHSKEMAQKELKEFIERHAASGDDGGRSGKVKKDGSLHLTLAPLDEAKVKPIPFDYSKRKKGLDE